MTPHTLCALAIAAAIVAAGIGWRYNPAARTGRLAHRLQTAAARVRHLEVSAARLRVAGLLASNPDAWERFWDDHQLDDALRGGTS